MCSPSHQPKNHSIYSNFSSLFPEPFPPKNPGSEPHRAHPWTCKDTLRQVFEEMGVEGSQPISFQSFFQAHSAVVRFRAFQWKRDVMNCFLCRYQFSILFGPFLQFCGSKEHGVPRLSFLVYKPGSFNRRSFDRKSFDRSRGETIEQNLSDLIPSSTSCTGRKRRLPVGYRHQWTVSVKLVGSLGAPIAEH